MKRYEKQSKILNASLDEYKGSKINKDIQSLLKHSCNVVTFFTPKEKETAQKLLYAITQYNILTAEIEKYYEDKETFVENKFDHHRLGMSQTDFSKRLKQLYSFSPVTKQENHKKLAQIVDSLIENLKVDYETVMSVSVKIQPFNKEQETLFKTTFPNYANEKTHTLQDKPFCE